MIEGTTNTAIEYFNLGLNSEIATRMIGKLSITLEQAISAAINCEKYVQQRKELHHDRVDDSRKRAYCHVTESQDEGMSGVKRRRCYQCKEPGHIARNCPTQKNSGLYCNFCKMIGHTFDACRERLRSHNPADCFPNEATQQFPPNYNNGPLNSQVVLK